VPSLQAADHPADQPGRRRREEPGRAEEQAMSPLFRLFFVLIVLFLLLCALVGCAASGIYQMTDRWCDAHPDAGKTRCDR
jgi:hypothetical protein